MLTAFYAKMLQAIFCPHKTTIRERDQDGSYWFRCTACDRRWECLSLLSRTKVKP